MNTFYGLLGQSLGHSMSPMLHQYIFEILGISAQYRLLEVEKTSLHNTIDDLKRSGAVGVNVTIPYKTEVMQYLDTLSPEAAAIGAVNTIAFRGEAAEGYNTDYFGFGMLLDRYGISTEGKEALVLGYGGGAKAVIRYLLDHGAGGIVVAVRNAHNRVLSNTPGEPDIIRFVDYERLPFQKEGALIINCTPVGMHPNVDGIPVSSAIIKRYSIAIDLIYNPFETMFLRHAAEAGLMAVNGLYMLVSQAVAAQEIWNDTHLSREDTDRIFNKVAEYMKNRYSP